MGRLYANGIERALLSQANVKKRAENAAKCPALQI
jgi:hypothetical protein